MYILFAIIRCVLEQSSYVKKKYPSFFDTLSLHFQLPLDVDPWKMVETHVLSDYMNHEVIEFNAAY